MKGLISIIIPVYNCEKYIEKCLCSILNQTYKKLEVIIVDDGSTDNSLKVCQEFQKKDSRIKVFHQKNGGVSKARNTGILNSNGEYISFIDCDDWINEKFYELLINGYKNENVDLSVIGIISVKDYTDINSVIVNDYKVLSKQDAYKSIFEDKNFFGFPVNKLYKKNIIDKLGENPFNEKIYACEDTLFNVNYLFFCETISYNVSKLYYYYQRMNSATKKQEFTAKKLTVFDSLDKINDIYIKESPGNLEYFYQFYLYNYFLIQMLIKKTKSKYNLKLDTAEEHFKYLMKSNKLSLLKKMKIFIKYKYPSIFDKLLRIKRR